MKFFTIFIVAAVCFHCAQGGTTDSGSSGQENSGDSTNQPESAPSGADSGPGSRSCDDSSECVLASSTCCECPSFAVPIVDGFVDGCEDVECDPLERCSAVEAVCDQGQCRRMCSVVQVSQVCEFGFVRDRGGCLLDECAGADEGDMPKCIEDQDCVRRPADCCGCARGGRDRAVLTTDASRIQQALGCSGQEVCPEVDVCLSEATPKCIGGGCFLVVGSGPVLDSSGVDGTRCGTISLGECGPGERCMLNYNDPVDGDGINTGFCIPL